MHIYSDIKNGNISIEKNEEDKKHFKSSKSNNYWKSKIVKRISITCNKKY